MRVSHLLISFCFLTDASCVMAILLTTRPMSLLYTAGLIGLQICAWLIATTMREPSNYTWAVLSVASSCSKLLEKRFVISNFTCQNCSLQWSIQSQPGRCSQSRARPNQFELLTLSSPVSSRLYTLPYWSNPPFFLIFDIWALWRSGLRAPKCQQL